MPNYEKLIKSLQKLVDDWRSTEGAYLNEFGDGLGAAANELETLIKPYLWEE